MNGEEHKRNFAIMVLCKFTCSWCGESGDDIAGPDGKTWHIDHIKPRISGGTDEVRNLTLSCETCNLSKSDRRYGPPMNPIMTEEDIEQVYPTPESIITKSNRSRSMIDNDADVSNAGRTSRRLTAYQMFAVWLNTSTAYYRLHIDE